MSKALDQDPKPLAGILYEDFPNAMTMVVEVATQGAEEYGRSSWKDVPDAITRYTDAMHRHLLAEQTGEKIDPESKMLHAAHAAWGALCRLELILRETQEKTNEQTPT